MDEIGEDEVLGASRKGILLDGAAGGAKRIVQASLLRRCCHELRDQIDPRGLRLANSLVRGNLDLSGLAVPFPLRFDGCDFDAPLAAEGAELFELSLTGCPRLPGLLGNGLRLRRDLDLSRSVVAGSHWTSASTSRPSAIWLCEAEIGGRLLAAGTEIDGQGGRSIHADRIRVGGAVRLIHQFTAMGEVRLIGARIDGSVDLAGAQIESADVLALDLEEATINRSVFLIEDQAGRRAHIRGRIDMASARISGNFHVRNATVEARAGTPESSHYAMPSGPGTALSAARLTVGAGVIFAGCKIKRPHRHVHGRHEQRVHR